MRVLVTGASGFLGSALVRELAGAGHEVLALVRTESPADRLQPLPAGVSLRRFGVLAEAAAQIAESRPDAVVHTVCNYGRHGEPLHEIAAVNLHFGLGILDAAAAAGVARFINTDTALDRHTNAYALSKKQFAEWGQWLAGQQRIRFVNVLLQHMYGPHDDASKFTTHVLRSCHANVERLALTPGQQQRDFIHIDDVAAAYRCLLEADLPEWCLDIDVGSGEAPTLETFVRLVHRLTNSRTQLDFGAVPYRAGEAMCYIADTTALRRLGWQPRYSLEAGLQHTIATEFPS